MEAEKPVIIYDGECRLCQRAVRFLGAEKNDTLVTFLPSSGPASKNLLRNHNIPGETTAHTVILIDNNTVYIKSEAVIRALQGRGGIWRFAGVFKIIPAFIRDWIYDRVARIRKPADRKTGRPEDQKTK